MATGNTAARRAWKKDYETKRPMMSVRHALFYQHESKRFFSGVRIILMGENETAIGSVDETVTAVIIENYAGLELHRAAVTSTADLLGTIEDLLSRTYAHQRYA